jgi:hypothetical protein
MWIGFPSGWGRQFPKTIKINAGGRPIRPPMDGFGLAYMPEDVAQPRLAKGRLKRVLDDWCPRYSGYHLYYTEPPAHPGFHPIGRNPSVPEMYAAIPAH